MRLKNHIAFRVLTDTKFMLAGIHAMHPDICNKIANDLPVTEEERGKMYCLKDVLSFENQRAFFVTETVLDKLDLLKVNRMQSGQWDWSIFKNIGDLKYTFILPDCCLRLFVNGSIMAFCDIRLDRKNRNDDGTVHWVHFFVDKDNNFECEHFNSVDVKKIDEFVYKLMCFVFLSENVEEVLKPGEKKGTRKQGKIINELPCPITLINSKWNVTSIRSEGFMVSGHFALYWTGPGRTIPKMLWVDPYEKKGYIRKAKNELINA